MKLNEQEKQELKRLLYVAISSEARNMTMGSIENAVYLMKKIDEPDDEQISFPEMTLTTEPPTTTDIP